MAIWTKAEVLEREYTGTLYEGAVQFWFSPEVPWLPIIDLIPDFESAFSTDKNEVLAWADSTSVQKDYWPQLERELLDIIEHMLIEATGKPFEKKIVVLARFCIYEDEFRDGIRMTDNTFELIRTEIIEKYFDEE